ncbi:MAG: MGMT family protein [Oscillospiraceae bacterium]|jgi:methylated-DNA-protein-cysteine methyltransferase-like protein|nr:MGMT family protein [Oscillospiraceae bacterium]
MPNFFAAVYAAVRQIPCGKVATYGQIARLCGNPRMARQVGWALHANPRPGQNETEIPCHRVVNRAGACCEGFAFGGIEMQQALLKAEGVCFLADGLVDMQTCRWEPEKS